MNHCQSCPEPSSHRPRRASGSRAARSFAILIAGLLTVAVPTVAVAQRSSRGVELLNMRVGFDLAMSTLKGSNSFKIGTWTPVWIQLKGGTERFTGFMDLVVGDDDGTPTAFRMPVDVPAGQNQSFTAYARPGSREPEFSIRLFDSDGRRAGGASQSMAMPAAPEAIMPNETLLLTMGRPQGVEAIAELTGFK